MDKELRNTLKNTVTKCRKLLEEAIGELLQGRFGIHVDGTIEDASRLTHLSSDELRYREEIQVHLEHIKASGLKSKDATAQLIREAAFTHLNRLCAYKIMAADKLIEDPIGKGLKSRGFMFYLAKHSDDETLYRSAQEEVAYRHYLDWLNEDLSTDIGVLFATEDLATRLFPPHRVLIKLLAFLNSEELSTVWSEDEAIGWVYQYFTPKELRERSRKEHPEPQNSYELAFRNQFYTPRYVVEFLVDNTLGRLWYEMCKGETALKEQCKYLVQRPIEVFLSVGEEPSNQEQQQEAVDLSLEELLKRPLYLGHRHKMDPRDLRVLDPACGSGHFLLYSFDVLQTIYREAYEDEELGTVLKTEYPTINEFHRDVPRLILENNLHGIDIDLRSTQICGLALWLRAQRAYKNYGIEKSWRPQVRKTNIVCAEPMPGERELLEEFLKEVYPPFLGDVVRVVFEKMKLAGEAGSLLKIEEEISGAVAEAKKHWAAIPQQQQLALFRKEKMPEGKQGALFDLSGISDQEFWIEAEARVLESLQEYAKRVATNGQGLSRRLFADDASQGFAFVDICRKRFDVVLMNPPFGEATQRTAETISNYYPLWNRNILCAFLQRGWELSAGMGAVGAIYDRTAIVKSTYENFRRTVLVPDDRLFALADLGWEVLDANVEVTTSVLHHFTSSSHGVFVDVRKEIGNTKANRMVELLRELQQGRVGNAAILEEGRSFQKLPNAVIGYDFPEFLRHAFAKAHSLEAENFKSWGGHTLKSDKQFRLWWELPHSTSMGFVARMFNGAGFSPYSTALRDCVIAPVPLEQLPKDTALVLRNKRAQMKPGVCFGKRGEYLCAHILPPGHIFTVEGQSFPLESVEKTLDLLGFLNTPLVRFSINKYCGQHKYSGYVNLLPYFALPHAGEIRARVRSVLELYGRAQQQDETQSLFSLLFPDKSITEFAKYITTTIEAAWRASKDCEKFCHEQSLAAFQPSDGEREIIESFRRTQPHPESPIEDADVDSNCRWLAAHSVLSHAIGCIFGRWDIRLRFASAVNRDLAYSFSPLGMSPPAALVAGDGLPITAWPDAYPLCLDSDGMLVDDEVHTDDIVMWTRNVFEFLWPHEAQSREREACELLEVRELRDYFRKPGAGGFWTDHVKRYSKSRRKAPIYWYLRSAKGNYGIWLYYHRLDKDVLFKALLNYVEPKLRLEENNLAQLKHRRDAVGTTGREGKQVEKDLDKQESFLSEIYDFRDKLKRAADLNLEPDLNDGIVLNIAPLWELVPWKEAEKYWKELLDGKYEWSSIAKQLRQRGIIQA